MAFERFEDEEYYGEEIVETRELICKDCKHRLDKSGECREFATKPLKVFKDGECDSYERESKVE